MKHFIILRGMHDEDVALAIEDIRTISTERNATKIEYGDEYGIWNVQDKVEDIVWKIQEIENRLKRE